MTKEAQIQLIKMRAFQDEFEKLAGPISNILVKKLPKLMMKYLGKSKIKSSKSLKTVFKGLGKARREGWSTGKILSRGASTAGKGAGKSLDKWEQYATHKRPFMGGKGGLKGVSKKYKSGTGGAREATQRTFFGIGGKAKPVARAEKGFQGAKFGDKPLQWAKEQPKKLVGNTARNLNLIRKKGLGKFTRHEINRQRVFERNGVLYRRSKGGQAAGAAFSGPGIGLMVATEGKDAKGNKRGLPKRIARGATSAGLWSTSPGIAFANEIRHML